MKHDHELHMVEYQMKIDKILHEQGIITEKEYVKRWIESVNELEDLASR